MILVFGKTGQVATELRVFKNIKVLGREHADLANPKACRDAILFYEPIAVINAAAYTAVDKAESEPSLVERINADAPAAMASACVELKIPLVHISTDYVFDGSGSAPWSTTDTPNPQNVYGRSKLQGEENIKSSGCTYAILRTSWVVSVNGNNFVKTMLQLSKRRDSLAVVDDQIGGPTCASDIAQTCVSIAQQLTKEPDKTGIYHYTGQPDVSWCQFANTIFEQTGRRTVTNPIPTLDYPTPASRPLNCRMDCSLIEATFNIPRPSWHDKLKDILEELEQKYDKA